MTIAACYLSSEGVVLGADSTTTVYVAGPDGGGQLHHLNYAQKVFEVGEGSTFAVNMWGMGAIVDLSLRTLIARVADDLASNPPASVQAAADCFCQYFWGEYTGRLSSNIQRFKNLDAKKDRTSEEDEERFGLLQNLSGGFCFGGYVPSDRIAHAFEIMYGPGMDGPKRRELGHGTTTFWGCPNIVHRVLFCFDDSLFDAILKSDNWIGTGKALFDLIWAHRIAQPFDLPLREAIDWLNTIIYTTIKSMKFSHLMPVCGGPIEISVISTDRKFRWVKHKSFDEALG